MVELNTACVNQEICYTRKTSLCHHWVVPYLLIPCQYLTRVYVL